MSSPILNSIALVLEGPECTGKTRLANHMMETFNVPMYKNVAIADRFNCLQSVCTDITQQQLRARGVGSNLVIFDRWQLVSDQIYYPLYKKEPSIFTQLEPVLSKSCIDAGILIVYVDATLDTMYNRFKCRGDSLVDCHTAGILHSKYQEFFANTTLPYLHVMTDNKSTDQLTEEIIFKARSQTHTRSIAEQLTRVLQQKEMII